MKSSMLTGLLALALGLVPVCAGAESPAFAIVEELGHMAEQSLWPGFDPREIPVAIYDGQHTYLFRHPNPPQEFTEDNEHPGVWVYEGHHESVRSNTSIELGGVHTATFILGGSAERSVQDWAAIAAHECFHVFQRARHPSWQANEADLFLYPADDAELLQLRRLESEALRRAVDAADPSEATKWAKGALELRRERFGRLGENFAAYERGSELNEGLAQYIQDLAKGDATGGGFPEEGFAPDRVRQRSYASGRALGVLLDRFKPDWKEFLEVNDSLALDDLLEEALAESPGSPARFSAAERQAALHKAEEDVAALAEQKRDKRREFLSQLGWKVVIEVKGDEPLWLEGFDPLNVLRVSEGEVLHTRFLKLGNSLGKLEVLGRAALSEAAGPHPIFNGVRRLTVTGFTAEPLVKNVDSWTSIQAEGFQARFAPAEVERTDQTLVLRVVKQQSAN